MASHERLAMRRWMKRMMRNPVLCPLEGAALGAAAAGLFAVLCGIVSVALTGRLPSRPALDFLRFVSAGAVAGLVVGLCRALDRAADEVEPEDTAEGLTREHRAGCGWPGEHGRRLRTPQHGAGLLRIYRRP